MSLFKLKNFRYFVKKNGMIKKGSKLYSVFNMKCPKCQEGDFFVAHPYNLKKAGDIHKNCSSCGLKYAKEPGFYYGALYVSYGLGVGLFVAFWVGFNLFFENVSDFFQIAVITAVVLVLTPYMYALSKIIWANMFISYEKK